MDPSIIALNLVYAVAGVLLMWLAYRLFDTLTPQVDFPEELRRGNVAVAIFIAARARAAGRLTGRNDPWFRKYTQRYFGVGFDWRLFKAQAVAESDLNPNARSPVGARGLMQVMPATFNLIQASRSSLTSIDAPESNIAAGIARSTSLDHTRWENIERVAPTVPRWRYRETVGYVRKIEATYAELRGQP